MAYLSSILFCMIIGMASSMPQTFPNPNVQNAQANDIVYPVQVDPNQGVQPLPNQQQPFEQQQLFNQQQPLDQQQPSQQPQQTVASGPGTLAPYSPAIMACVRNCPSTFEQNPVCGTNLVVYPNIARMDCANRCGQQLDPNWQTIQVLFAGGCSPGGRVP